MVSYMIQDGDRNCTEGATILDISNEKLPLPQFKDGKNDMFQFSCEPITELGGWEVLFLFLFHPRLSEVHNEVTRSYIYISYSRR